MEKRYETTGSLAKRPLNRSFKKLDPVKLTAYVKEHPDTYLREIGEVFGCTDDAVRLALIKLGIMRKKDEEIERLNQILLNMQRDFFGQRSEKPNYVLGDNTQQLN